jgi:uncharacterized protein
MMSRTPQSLLIKPRNEQFALGAVLASEWHSNDPFKTAYFNALSILFPIGEKFFIDSVREHIGFVKDAKLLAEVRGFIGQEAVHMREHQQYNEALCAARGLDLADFEDSLRARIAMANKELPPLGRLAITVAYEHFTAVLADAFLKTPEIFAGAHPEMTRLWRWHAIEETEHKSVAYDVYLAAGGTQKGLRKAMVYVTQEFVRKIIFNMRLLLRAAPGNQVRLWVTGLRWIYSMWRPLWANYRDFYRDGFHPWQHDNRDVLAEAVARYGAPALAV